LLSDGEGARVRSISLPFLVLLLATSTACGGLADDERTRGPGGAGPTVDGGAPTGGSSSAGPSPSSSATTASPANECILVRDMPPSLGTVNLTTGKRSNGPLLSISDAFVGVLSGLAVVGDSVLFCHRGRVVQASLANGAVKLSVRSCDALAGTPKAFYVLYRGVLEQYSSFDAFSNGKPPILSTDARDALAIGGSSSGLFLAVSGPARDDVVRPDGTRLTLQGHDDSIDGLTGAPDGRLIVSSPNRKGSGGPLLLAFDPTDGRRLGLVSAGDTFERVAGVVCRP